MPGENPGSQFVSDDPSDASLTHAQSGVTRWYHEDLGLKAKTNNKGQFSTNVEFAAAGTYYVQAVAKVDQDWATQGTSDKIPVPKVKPQTHIVNARTNDGWMYSNNDRVVRGQTVWTSQVAKFVVE
ncbi:unnamed protein product [Phytophthora lilii]|uniref:Unnamed protein product n=1 Tax=Phytophthora lilii TaxID=2077276 RepID=A0A9W6X331_9STRA|nr:unnamed protein product [Phytophthora lilii]